jgi:hypothetical protein
MPTVLAIGTLALATNASAGNFVTHLSGAAQVPPVETQAQGQAVLNERGGELSYKLIVANLENVVAAHIHCAPADQNGPVGVTLFAGVPTTINGILAQGPILAPDAGNACGWAGVEDVIDALGSGNTYVNVHTLEHLPGEIRGQID